MKPVFAYYGGKTRFAPWIASLLPTHRVYVEPFAGSAAVLLAKAPVRHEVLNDLDGQVVNFYRVLRERCEDLELAVSLTPYSREEYALADFDEPGIDDLERARRWWVRSTQGFGQSATKATGWSISTQQNSPRMHQITNRMPRFAAVAERLRHVFIENQPALDIIERHASTSDACLYLDPPYLASTRTAPNCYRHEMGDDDSHRALAASVEDAKAHVVVSGYASPLYDEDLFAGWHRVERQVVRRAGNGRTRRLDNAVEVLWSNRPLADAADLFGDAS